MPIDVAVLVGEYASAAASAIAAATGRRKRVVTCTTVEEACTWLRQNLKAGDVVLVEGGETNDMAAIVRDLVRFGSESGGRSISTNPRINSIVQ